MSLRRSPRATAAPPERAAERTLPAAPAAEAESTRELLRRFGTATSLLQRCPEAEVPSILAEQLTRVAQGEGALVWLLEPGMADLLLPVAAWPAGEHTRHPALPLADSPAIRHALELGEPVLAAEPGGMAEPRFGTGTRGLCWVVPLLAGATRAGAALVASGAAADTASAAAPLLQAIAAQAALRIEAATIERRVLRAQGEFLNVAAHDLRNVTTSLKGYVYLLQRRLSGADDDRLRRWSSLVAQQADALADALVGLVEVGRVASGRRALRVSSLELGALVRETVESFEHRRVSVELPTQPLHGCWDGARLQRALAAAVDSAVRRDDAGCHVRVRADSGGPHISIGPVEQPPFGAAAGWSASADLGLHTARALIEAHGGTVRCRELPNGSLTVEIVLPWRTVAASG